MSITRKATCREWIGLVVLALPCLLAVMDLTVLGLAVPQRSADLKPSGTQLLWIVDDRGRGRVTRGSSEGCAGNRGELM